jgi:hypothetical protein
MVALLVLVVEERPTAVQYPFARQRDATEAAPER